MRYRRQKLHFCRISYYAPRKRKGLDILLHAIMKSADFIHFRRQDDDNAGPLLIYFSIYYLQHGHSLIGFFALAEDWFLGTYLLVKKQTRIYTFHGAPLNTRLRGLGCGFTLEYHFSIR